MTQCPQSHSLGSGPWARRSKHFGFRESDDELCLQHLTTPEVMREYLEYRRLHPTVFNYAVDMGFYRHVIRDHSKDPSQRPTNGAAHSFLTGSSVNRCRRSA